MTDPVFGLVIYDDSEVNTQTVISADLSIVGLVGTAPDADLAIFPLNFPVLMSSSDAAKLSALGTSGTIPDALQGINDQLGDYQAAATVIVTRCAPDPGGNDFLTIQNLIGTEAAESGIHSWLISGELLGAIPRICSVPGYTHQAFNVLGTLVLGATGSGYPVAPIVTFGGGGSDPNLVLPTAHATLGSAQAQTQGQVASLIVDTVGANITAPLTVTIAPPPAAANGQPANVQATAVATVERDANAVCAALPGILSRILGHAVVEGPGTTEADADAWRQTIDSQRLIPLDMWVNVQIGDVIAARPGAPRVIGIAVRRDFEYGGVPSHSWANQPVQGIVSFVRRVGFSLTDGSTEGQRLLTNNIGIGVRGELGVESAIASSGFVYIGTDVATDDTLWTFYNVTRMRDYINLGLLKTLRYYLGRNNITLQVLQAVLNTMDGFMTRLQTDNHILGFRIVFDPAKNDPANVRAGRIRVGYKAEPAPVLRRIDIDADRYIEAINILVEEIASTASNISSTAVSSATASLTSG